MDQELYTELLAGIAAGRMQQAPGVRCCVCTHQMATLLCEMMSWPPSWSYDVISEIRVSQSMRILLEEHSCQISSQSDLKRLSLAPFWRASPQQWTTKRRRTARWSVPDPKVTNLLTAVINSRFLIMTTYWKCSSNFKKAFNCHLNWQTFELNRTAIHRLRLYLCDYIAKGNTVAYNKWHQSLSIVQYCGACEWCSKCPLFCIISYLRDSAEANIGIRVGVHSGRVESAIVGLSRWRYDIWSADVQLTEHVVQAGLPGSVRQPAVYKHWHQWLCLAVRLKQFLVSWSWSRGFI